MNVYRRFFRITNGPLIEAWKVAKAINKEAHLAYRVILSEIGANCDTYWQRGGTLMGIKFDERPDTTKYKRCDGGGWYPKRNTKFGRELHARIKAVKTKDPNTALEAVGLSTVPSIFTGGHCYFSTLVVIPADAPVAFVSVPWYDEDPAEIEAYLKDENRADGNLEALMWKPTDDMEEVKEWQVGKEIDEWNESVRERKVS